MSNSPPSGSNLLKFLGILAGLAVLYWFFIAPPPTLEAEAWASSEKAAWPQFVLENDARFSLGQTPLKKGNAFLIEVSSGRVVGATAQHLLGARGGVDPAVAPETLNDVLASWKAAVPRSSRESVNFKGRLGSDYAYASTLDTLILEVEAQDRYPVTPLKAQRGSIRKNQEVFVVSSKTSKEARQTIVWGTASLSAFDFMVVKFAEPAQWSGLEGSPVLNKRGHLVALVMGSLDTVDDEGELWSVAAVPVDRFAHLLR